MVCSDHRVIYIMIAEELNMNSVRVHKILVKDIGMEKLAAKLVP